MAEEQRSGDEGPDSPKDETVVTPPADEGGETEIIRPPDGADATRMMPPAEATPAWSGRAGVPTPEPMPRLRDSTAPGYQTGTPPPSSGRTWWTPLLLGMLALGLLGIVILAAWLMTRDTSGSDKPTSSPTPGTATSAPLSPSVAPSASISPTVSPEQLVQIPVGLIGLDQDEAAAQLQVLGLFWNFSYQPSSQPQNTVIGTKPGQGELIPAGSTVTIVVAIPQSQSPSVSPSPSASKKN